MNWFSSPKYQEERVTSIFEKDLADLVSKIEELRSNNAELIDQYEFNLLDAIARVRLERTKSIVFMRLNAALDRKDKKAIELYREIQEVMR